MPKLLAPLIGGMDATLATATVTTLTLTNAITQAKSHASPDTDSATSALHHTLGTGANQAAAGNDSRLSDARTPSNDASLVHLAGTETITGYKYFSNAIIGITSTSRLALCADLDNANHYLKYSATPSGPELAGWLGGRLGFMSGGAYANSLTWTGTAVAAAGAFTAAGLLTASASAVVTGSLTVSTTLGVTGATTLATLTATNGTFSGTVVATGSVTGSTLIEKSVVFTPTTVGWYRIVNAGGLSAGLIRITGSYDGAWTDLEFSFSIGGYGVGGAIQQTRYSSYVAGNISQARISSNGGASVYLDVYVSTSTTPSALTVLGYGPTMSAFVAAPVVGATVGSTNPYTLTFGHGFRSTAEIIGTYGSFSSTLGVTGATTLAGMTATTGSFSSTVATGALTVTGAISASTTITAGTGLTVTTGSITASNGSVLAKSSTAATGWISADAGTTTYSGFLSIYGYNGTRQGYIGATTSTATVDAGSINYVSGTHAFVGAATFSSTLGVTGAVGTGALTVTGAISATTTITAGTGLTVTTGDVICLNGNVAAKSSTAATGSVAMIQGGTGNAGYIDFRSPNGTRAGYIGNGIGTVDDTGTIQYVAATHGFTGAATFSSTVATGALTVTGAITASTKIIAGTGQGFQNLNYVGGLNPIWSFAGATAFGMAYYQVNTDILSIGMDAIGFHFGNTSTPPFYVKQTGAIVAASLVLSTALGIASGGTNSTATPTAGGAGYGTGTAHAYTAAGSAGQVLTSNGASAPTWQTASGGGGITKSVNASPPSSPATNDLWLVTDRGTALPDPPPTSIMLMMGA